MNIDDFLDHHRRRHDGYQLLSTFYYPPEADTLSKLSALQATLGSLCPPAQPAIANMQTEQNVESLQIDFASLFVGPFKLLAPPYGSIYLEGKREVMGDSTLDTLKRYRAAGLELSGDVKEAPDHIAFELEFVYYLTFKMVQAVDGANTTDAINCLEQMKGFLTKHPGRWIGRFTEAVQQNAGTDFYRSLAVATQLFVQQDSAEISQLSAAQLTQMMQQQVI
jgi:TorA maturation chaperone TorD